MNISKKIYLRLESSHSIQGVRSDFLESRNYTIEEYQYQPKLSLQPNNSWRISVLWGENYKENILNLNGEKGFIRTIGGEFKINQSQKRTINANINMLDIRYDGDINTPLGYEMTNALPTGINYKWQVRWLQKLKNGLQMTIIYDGRRTPEKRVIHQGRMQITALF